MPRNTALDLLNRLDKEKYTTLDRLIENNVNKKKFLSKQNRALFNIIIYGVLRQKKRIDYIINHFLKQPFNKIDNQTLNILRIGVFQLKFLDKIPDSAAVNTSVELAKKYKNQWSANFVNAVLRNVLRNSNVPKLPDKKENILKYISITESFPEWLIKKRIKSIGAEKTKLLCEALNKTPSITVRVNSLKIGRDNLIKKLTPFVNNISACKISSDGINFIKPSTRIDKLPGYKEGFFQVQDEAAQLAARLLAPKQEEKVLDAFAGLGGKTGHIAALMNNQGKIIAADYDQKKLALLDMAAQRLGITNIITREIDFLKKQTIEEKKKFDKILIDAPCSGLGVIRRNPDTKWSVSQTDLQKNGLRQIKLLENLSGYLKKNGTMLYTVCSAEPEENEEVITTFLSKHPEFVLKEPCADKKLLFKIGYSNKLYKTFTHIHNTDCFFYACLRREK
ncbi:MAG: 16S rRNA (cytosine(967)-C(5))-methyltransferase RsmB [Deltaproteobacteria bacterium]|nr:16S rRNA (cytosine(967)-C(5))-methyltransferase RsmB [Deltaproteobacteria bacterium]